ncbi:S8 family peptidase [Bacillus sp. 1P06AnD]|uniref:S8 family peptidase n=1 Tax=Bacillus sp. 1P06AnD TaxID=3132208 RepID=UPI0039A20191
MKKLFNLLVVAMMLLLLPHSYSAGEFVTKDGLKAASSEEPSIVKQSLEDGTRVNILFKDTVDQSILQKHHVSAIHTYDSISAVTGKMDPEDIESLKREPAVKDVKEDRLVEVVGQRTNWGYSKLNMENRIPISSTGKGVKIAVIDSGIDTTHPDLKVAGGVCVMNTAYEPNACANSYNDNNGHGTHVAGIIAAQDNEVGVLGVAPGASLYAVKALDSHGFGVTSSIMAAMDWSIKNKMDIINLSLTTPDDDPAFRALIQKAYKEGILIVAAAGNYSAETGLNVLYPAKYPEVISVSALGRNGNLIATSARGKDIELTAPGGDILSTLPLAQDDYDNAKDGYGMMSGTSMAAPFVTAMAALYKEKFPLMTNVEIRELLEKNAKDLGVAGRDSLYGYGLVQADTSGEADTEVTGAASENGTIKLTVDKLPEGANAVNVYRYKQKILANVVDKEIIDYASKGDVEYIIVPTKDGKEIMDQAIHVLINLESPAYKDMNNSYWYNRNIMFLNQRKIMNGYSSGEMKPKKTITRMEAVVLLANALQLDISTTNKEVFKDVKPGSFGAPQVAAAYQKGILAGFKDGTFRGNQSVTRAEMSIMVANAFNLKDAGIPVAYNDLSPSMSGYKQIHQVSSNLIAQGYGDGTFKPYMKMDRSSFAVFLSRAINPQFKPIVAE